MKKLFTAIRQRDLATVTALLDKKPELIACTAKAPPKKDIGQSPLQVAIKTNNYVIAHLLLDVVAKGGNLALNLAPQPDGRLPLRAVAILKEFSKWMHIFQDAIHCTRAVAPYRVKDWAFTQAKDGSKVNAFYLYKERESVAPKIVIPYKEKVTKVTDMRSGKELAFKAVEGGIEVFNEPNAVGHMGDIADCYIIE